jgi:hypothetical protein
MIINKSSKFRKWFGFAFLILQLGLALGKIRRRLGQSLVSAYALILTTAAPQLSSAPNSFNFEFFLNIFSFFPRRL